MTGSMIHPLHTMLSGPGVYEAIFEIGTVHLLHVTVAWCVEGTFLQTPRPALVVGVPKGAVLGCQSLLRQLKSLHKYQNLFFNWGTAGLRSFAPPSPEPRGQPHVSPESLWQRLQEGHSPQKPWRAHTSHLVTRLARGLLDEQSPIWFVQKLVVVQDPTSNHSFPRSLDT